MHAYIPLSLQAFPPGDYKRALNSPSLRSCVFPAVLLLSGGEGTGAKGCPRQRCPLPWHGPARPGAHSRQTLLAAI